MNIGDIQKNGDIYFKQEYGADYCGSNIISHDPPKIAYNFSTFQIANQVQFQFNIPPVHAKIDNENIVIISYP